MNKKVALILCGSGFKDGSEIRESVAALYALSKHDLDVACFSPNENQYNVVNNKTGDELPNQFRNQLLESARIARGEVEDIKLLKAKDYDAVIIPGGYGAAKHLCNYAIRGIEGSLHPEMSRVLTEFHEEKKPIGALCIAPMILAMHFKKNNLKITFGAVNTKTADDAEKLGHTLYSVDATRAIVDQGNLIVTTPAYMDENAKLHQIFEGIEALVIEIKNLIK